jgi:hypothetical protein
MGLCVTPWQICAVRITRLDSGGTPQPGEQAIYVTDKTISLGVTVETQEGNAVVLDSGCGENIMNFTPDDKVLGRTLSLESGVFDFEMLALMTGAPVHYENDIPLGLGQGVLGTAVGVEAWVRLYAGDERMAHPVTGKAATMRLIFPRVTWTLDGEQTYNGTAPTTTTLRGRGQGNTQWGTGPMGDTPTFTGPEYRWIDDEDDMPEADCEFQALAS